jgi:hypothetical protein
MAAWYNGSVFKVFDISDFENGKGSYTPAGGSINNCFS